MQDGGPLNADAPKTLSLSDLEGTPPSGTLLCQLNDLPNHGGKEIIFTEGQLRTSIFVQKTDDTVAVFLNHCPHAGTPLNMLGDRFLDMRGQNILCRTHGATFNRTTGKCISGPCKGRYLKSIAHRVINGAIISL